jgi:serine protease AprX
VKSIFRVARAAFRSETLAHTLVVAGILAAMTLDATAAQRGARPKLDPALWRTADHANSTDQVEVIVRTDASRLSELRSRFEGHGDRILDEQAHLGALTVVMHAGDLRALEADPSVTHLSANAIVEAHAGRGDSLTHQIAGQRALVDTLGLADAKMSGKGVGVAVLDSGIQPSADLSPERFYDFTQGDQKAAPYDDYGHGTHVSGLIAGRSSGIAPSARLIVLKVLDGQGQGTVSTVVRAIEFVIANRDRLRIDILNISLGHAPTEPAMDDPLVQAVERATRAGLIVVASAGNSHGQGLDIAPYGDITSPGSAPSAITVGALDTHGTTTRADDGVTEYSSRGPTAYDGMQKPDVVAPGANLISNGAVGSLLYGQYPERRVDDVRGIPQLFRLSGTSMAAAVTSGLVALLVEQNRHTSTTPLTANLVKAILQFSALSVPGDAFTRGTGALNGAGALELVGSVDMATSIGEWSSDKVVLPITTIDGEDYVWGQTVIWGTTVIWGNAVYVNEPAWSASTVWGTTVIWGNAVVR